MQTQFNLRDRPLADEMRPHFLGNHELDKRYVRMVLAQQLETMIHAYNRKRDEATRRAMSW